MLSAVVKLEPEVHIIEKHLQISEGFFTKTNIKVDRRGIDLLAIHTISGEKFHAESTVHTNRKLNIMRTVELMALIQNIWIKKRYGKKS